MFHEGEKGLVKMGRRGIHDGRKKLKETGVYPSVVLEGSNGELRV